MADDVIFQPLNIRNLTVKNRVFRSNISGRFDNYDGSGNQARINWEVKFAKGGPAIISSFVPVHQRDPAELRDVDADDKIRSGGSRGRRSSSSTAAHHAAQPRAGGSDVPGIEYPMNMSSTDKKDLLP
jgi:2,4-dienoyl-CoA reductase (NADPH2)